MPPVLDDTESGSAAPEERDASEERGASEDPAPAEEPATPAAIPARRGRKPGNKKGGPAAPAARKSKKAAPKKKPATKKPTHTRARKGAAPIVQEIPCIACVNSAVAGRLKKACSLLHHT